MISAGDAARDVTLPCDGGGTIRLADLRPGRVVLVTYGGDGTASCTNEVMEFNGLLADFSAAGVTVVGLSKDSVQSHDKFIAKMGIEIVLASDHGGRLMEDWGHLAKSCFSENWCKACCGRRF